jgi:FkbM family methyltransferase
MEGFAPEAPAVAMVAPLIHKFTLIDVGCGGGIDSIWRLLGDRLHAIGFDPNVENCRYLSERETNGNIRYIPAFVEIDKNHPFAVKRANGGSITRNPWARLAIHRTLQIKQTQIEKMSHAEKTSFNAWSQVELSPQHLTLPRFFAENGVDDIDFFKIDIDGADFDVLSSMEEEFGRTTILGIGMEVNYIGDASDTAHTFHNTDRFMRRLGFDLFNLTVRRYSTATLPSRYLCYPPSISVFGRPLQGDAIYIRDICAPHNADFAERLSPEKLLKTALIFAISGLPDHAAEALVTFRTKAEHLCDVTPILDALVKQASPGCGLTFEQYREAFARDDLMFYPSRRRWRSSRRG